MIRTLLKEVRQYKAASIATPLFMILEVLMEMVIPFLMASIIDDGVNAGDIHHIYRVGAVMIVAALIGLLAGVGGGRFGAKASAGFARNLRKAMFDNIQTFSFSNIDKYSTAGLVTRLTTDVTNVQNAYQMLLRMFTRAPASLLCAMVMAFTINARLAVIYLIAVIVLGGNVIKNKIIPIDKPISNENLLKLNMLLNTTLNGMAIEEINLGLIARLKEQAGIHSEVIGNVLDAVADAIQIDEDMQIYTSGATNIFKYPELSDKQSAQEIISAFEEKQQLTELVTQTLSREDNTGIQVYIGDETPVQTMKDCSVVTATYELGEGMKGTIGIIGPKRMDYEHVLRSMKRLQNELDQMFHKKE